MKTSIATWRFPESNFGLFQDFNDNQTTHFTRAPINHLVRECIQNSMDAKEVGGGSVEVSFAETLIPTALLDVGNYRRHLQSCIEIALHRGNSRAIADYERAVATLDADQIRTLRIQDASTTGLAGRHWEALVSSQGAVHKNNGNGIPGGSFGVGKNVVLLFSEMHAVIYSTRYANRHEGAVQKAIGRAQLMSHPKKNSEDHYQPNGWLDINRNPITGRDMPNAFRLNSQGTSIFILGWNPPAPDWREEMALRIAQNFFYAIHHRMLNATVSAHGETPITVDHRTLEDLLSAPSDRDAERYLNYYRATRKPEPPLTVGAKKPAVFDLYIDAGGGPNRTALINRNGMFITDATSLTYNPLNLRHKSTWPDYAIVAMPGTDNADQWLRRMENPSHDSISPEQLRDPREQTEATRMLGEIRREVRAIIDDLDGHTATGTTINVAELADVLPEVGGDSPGPDFEVIVTTAKPSLGTTGAPGEGDGVADKESDASVPGVRDIEHQDDEEESGDENSDGSKDPEAGDNPDRDVRDTDETPAKPGAIRHHRIIAADSYSAHVFITAEKAAPIRVAVKPAGAEFRREPSLTIIDVEAINCPDLEISGEFPAESFAITPIGEQRIHLELTFEDSIDNLALKIA